MAVLMALLALPAAAQAQSPDARPSVEVATIKPAAPDAIRNRVMPTAPNRLYIPSMSLAADLHRLRGSSTGPTGGSVPRA